MDWRMAILYPIFASVALVFLFYLYYRFQSVLLLLITVSVWSCLCIIVLLTQDVDDVVQNGVEYILGPSSSITITLVNCLIPSVFSPLYSLQEQPSQFSGFYVVRPYSTTSSACVSPFQPSPWFAFRISRSSSPSSFSSSSMTSSGSSSPSISSTVTSWWPSPSRIWPSRLREVFLSSFFHLVMQSVGRNVSSTYHLEFPVFPFSLSHVVETDDSFLGWRVFQLSWTWRSLHSWSSLRLRLFLSVLSGLLR